MSDQHHRRIPKRLQIETILGCNAKCIMCAVSRPLTRKKGIMSRRLFRSIVDSMVPYKESIEKVDLFGLGEPLLDPYIFERIQYVRHKGFRNLAISTNADLLDFRKQCSLLDSGIETVILSIDGVQKKTHENVRPGVKFERVVENCENIIRLRNEKGAGTRFVIRFVRQLSNKDEWKSFLEYWKSRIPTERNDLIIRYDVNTMGGEVQSKKEILGNYCDKKIEVKPCHQILDRLIVLKDGTVPLCCEDTPHARFAMGDVNTTSPLDIFNGEMFNNMRTIHLKGNKNDIAVCRECTLLYSENAMQVYP